MSLIGSSQDLAGHPIWHFAIVAAGGVLTFLGLKVSEWRQTTGLRRARVDVRIALLGALGLACCGIHAYVCPEHFQEWVVYGVFFMCASVLQAIWSVAVLVRPSRRLLLIGAVGNAGVIVTYFISRFVGIPFGPDAFQPETYDALSMIATTCEAAVVALATYIVSPPHWTRRPAHPAISRSSVSPEPC